MLVVCKNRRVTHHLHSFSFFSFFKVFSFFLFCAHYDGYCLSDVTVGGQCVWWTDVIVGRSSFQMAEGIPTDVTSFKFFLWVGVPVIWCAGGYVLIKALDAYYGVA